MNSQERAERILVLKKELQQLLQEDAKEALKHADISEAEFKNSILMLMQQGRMVEAIKSYRAKTGFSLGEAREAVNKILSSGGK